MPADASSVAASRAASSLRGAKKDHVWHQRSGAFATPAQIRLEACLFAQPFGQDSALIKALARAHRWQRILESGECGSITEVAAAEKIDRSYLCRVLRLTLLAPEIFEAIMDGRQAEGMTLPALMKGFRVEWQIQRSSH